MEKVAGDIVKKASKKPIKIDPFDAEAAGRKRTEVENDWRQEMLADGHPPEAVDAAIEAARKHKVDLSDVWTFSDLNQKIGALSDTSPTKGKRGGKVFSSLAGQVEKIKAEIAELKGEQGSIGPDVKAGMEARKARLGKGTDIPELQDITPQSEFDVAREESKAKAKRMVEQMTREHGDITSAGLDPAEKAAADKALAVRRYASTMDEQKFAPERRTNIPDIEEGPMGLENVKNIPGIHEFSPDLPENQARNRRQRMAEGRIPDISDRSPAAKLGRRGFLASQNIGALAPEGPPRRFGLADKVKKEVGRFFSDETGAAGPDVKKGRATKKSKLGPPDMFDKQDPQLDSASFSFSHEGFLGDLRESPQFGRSKAQKRS